MFNETLQFIQSHSDIINPTTGIITAFSGVLVIFVMIWLAFRNPDAKKSQIENNEYFKQQRKKHFRMLQESVFEPLSSIIAQNKNPQRNIIGLPQTLKDKLLLDYDISRIINDDLYNLACLHLDIDFRA